MTVSAKIISLKPSKNTEFEVLPLSLEHSALTHGDELTLWPLTGAKRKLKLARTNYRIVTAERFGIEDYGSTIYIPALPSERGKILTIELKSFRRATEQSAIEIYEISSNHLFRLNGQWLKHAYLQRKDRLEFCLSKIQFHSKDKTQEAHCILSDEIVLSDLSILLEGETGTGKSTLAKNIHKSSGKAGKFIHLNLSAFSPSLVESELFGHTKGAFTGAAKEKSGALLEANHGTLFLDEVDSLSKELQLKLLLFFDNGLVRPVGGCVSHQVKTRIITASGACLKSKVLNGEMRSDFYHRISSGACVKLKSLREDSSLLISFVTDFENKYNRVFSKDLIKSYCSLKWSGNFRQLSGHLMKKHILKPKGILCWDECDEDLLFDQCEFNLANSQRMDLRELKRSYIKSAMAYYGHHPATVSKVLGVAENTVRRFS